VKHSEPSAIGRFLGGLTGKNARRNNQARLEAFLGAFPGEYCGWGKDGSVAYSAGFTDMLSLEKIEALSDIQDRLVPKDSASLESLFGRLREQGIKFSTSLSIADSDKVFRFSGARGYDISGSEHFDVLWIEDRTADQRAAKRRHDEKSAQHSRLQLLENAVETLANGRAQQSTRASSCGAREKGRRGKVKRV